MANETKGRPLPPLLPLEYCSIERAAQMLECETEDILHWFEIGAVNLSVNTTFDSLSLMVNTKTRNELLELAKSNTYDDEDYFTLVINCCHINIKHSELDGNDHWLQAFSSRGVWRIIVPSTLKGLYEGRLIYVSTGKEIADKISFRGIPFADGLPPKINLSDLVITSDQVHLLHDSITSGKPLANRYNNSEIAAEAIEREKELISNPKQDRLTPGKAKAVTALTELALKLAGEDADLMNNPHKLHRRINELMLEHKVNKDGGYSLGISDTAYRDLIGAGRSAQSKDGK